MKIAVKNERPSREMKPTMSRTNSSRKGTCERAKWRLRIGKGTWGCLALPVLVAVISIIATPTQVDSQAYQGRPDDKIPNAQ